MYDFPHDYIEALRATPDTLFGLLAGRTREQALAARGGDEGWSVVGVICHLRDAEERAIERTKAMRDEDEPVIAGYDQDAWARERGYEQSDLYDALGAFLGLRADHVAILAALAPGAWERSGRHEEWGRITIAAHTLHMISHDAVHAAQIARQLRTVPSLPGSGVQ